MVALQRAIIFAIAATLSAWPYTSLACSRYWYLWWRERKGGLGVKNTIIYDPPTKPLVHQVVK